ncbi:hypothetical protein [Paenibacillus sp. R14(2021)]|uniref:hypothetical protein n=1 Tax=Paenibacillus sp. R14(2021) TaxID=2859228 RepID=UPI001C614059|nr:hypothetical protein [Paenibacillus sp. R14(2021)]
MGVTKRADQEGWSLGSNRLRVQVAKPGTAYRGSRFDWTGLVTEVRLDERHTFCTKESFVSGQGTGGIGLCNEFGISLPVGYEEARVGETFPKLGVGLLTRVDDAAYGFARSYPIAPFPVDVHAGKSSLTFTVHPLVTRGYAVRLIKTVSVEQNRLRFVYELSNVGEVFVATNEYGHNFVNLDGHAVGPEYRLRLPDGFAFESSGSRTFPLEFENCVMRWMHVPEGEFYCRSTASFSPGLQWELTHESGVGMREHVNFAPSMIALWGTKHVVSPEVFLHLELEPGETTSWTRELEFYVIGRE